jgi:EAL domain-containing protein (putative c-di-GMP-specific phosphodiesterase class I)
MIEKELRIAIEDFSQFQLYYQPKLDLKTKRIIGAEVLLRWCHPTKGYIPPSEFISVAESTELIHILGEWVVEQTCQNIQMWESAVELPSGFHVAINLSPKQLFGNKTLRVLSSQISKHKIDVARLHIEVTETALMFDKLSAKKTLDDLREMGIEVWLDDFGTGYSSLCFLREFNIDGLKIDRSFVNDIEHDTNDRALCAAIVTMAHQLGIKVIAEGIETPYHSDFLAQLNCDFGQGYLFAKPVPTEEMSNMLQNGIDGPLDS